MPLDYEYMSTLVPRETAHVYGPREVMLYAVGVGACLGSPSDENELDFVFERKLRALPTIAAILTYPGFWLSEPEHRLNWKRLLHAEQSITFHKPIPPAGDLVGVTTVDAIFDKGAEKGALLYTTRRIRVRGTNEPLATVRMGYMLRGDGGFGGSSEGAPKPHIVPTDRAPDVRVSLKTRPEQALLYRLSGDMNPLHVDPEIARGVGFERPILHGLCTYGFAGRAVVRALCNGEPAKLKRFDVRFASPVYPGETLEVGIWNEGPGLAGLTCHAVERDILVLSNGRVEFEVE